MATKRVKPPKAEPAVIVREIFHYHDGKRERAADPIEAFRMLAEHASFNLDEHIKQLTAEDLRVSLSASSVAVQATREVFGIETWSEDNESGLTALETINVLMRFIEYLDSLKKNGNGQAT